LLISFQHNFNLSSFFFGFAYKFLFAFFNSIQSN
jgi:hypothetical protein